MALSTAEQSRSLADAELMEPTGERSEPGSLSAPLTPTPFAFLGDQIITVPNLVTLVRTMTAVVIAGIALSQAEPWLLAVAYAVYWAGDILDGWLARRLGQETRLGAVFDIISDRACTSILCVGLVANYPGLAIVVVPFFLSFMVLDTVLSLSFLCWPLLSPNYFGRVDRAVYQLNWSPLAKCLNTAGVILLALAGAVWASLVLVALLVGVKIWSVARVQRLLRPCAAGEPR